MPAPVFFAGGKSPLVTCRVACACESTYHDDNLARAPVGNVLRQRIQRARLERLRRRIWIHDSRLVLPHSASFAFAFTLSFSSALAPRLVLLRLLAVGFALASYGEAGE